MKFVYIATNQQGDEVSGEIEAANDIEALRILDQQSLVVRALAARENPPAPLGEQPLSESTNADGQWIGIAQSMPRDQIDSEKRDRVAMLVASIASEATSSQQRRGLHHELRQLASTNKESGDDQSLRWRAFWPWLSASGSLPLGRLIRACDTHENDSPTTWRVLLYPSCILFASLAFMILILTGLVPMFDSMFTDFNLELPLPTQTIIGLSRFVTSHPLGLLVIIAILAGGLVWTVIALRRLAIAWRVFPRLFQGNRRARMAMASIADRMACLIRVDVPPAQALRVAGQLCGHSYFRDSALTLARTMDEFPGQWRQSYLVRRFPANLILAMGEDSSSSNAQLLDELATIYRSSSDRHSGQGLLYLLAHGMVVLAGLSLMLTILSLFLPLVCLVSSL